MNTHCIIAFRSKGLFISLAFLFSLVVLSCASLGGSARTKSPTYADTTYTIPKPSELAPGTGGLKGRVTEKESGTGFFLARIEVLGTNLGGKADSSGFYMISDILPGKYTVQAWFPNFETVKVKNVVIQPGRIKHLDFKIKPLSGKGII